MPPKRWRRAVPGITRCIRFWPGSSRRLFLRCSLLGKAAGRSIRSILLCALLIPAGVYAAGSYDLAEMSLEELLEVEVFSAARREQSLFETAAAVEVITGEEIRRSGANRLPEALRLASGVHVRQIDASKWGITVRGFINRFANKLLVLIDGRPVYSHLFAGVFWEVQDLPLEEVERIEVIRGPGGTLWGANAVNGVINIITRSAAESQGSSLKLRYGPEEKGLGTVRYGGSLGEQTFYRVYGKGFRRDGLALESGERASDDWRMIRGGFRLDGERRQGKWMLCGGAYDGRMWQRMEDGFSLIPPYMTRFDFATDLSGGHLLGRYERRFSPGAELRTTAYYDWSERRDHRVFGGSWQTLAFDLQHRFAPGERQMVVWGGEFRSTHDDLEETERFAFHPPSRTTRVFSGFLQDEIRVLDARFRLIVGSKLEHNSFTGLELLPNLRLAWTDGKRTLWGAISRAVRLPARGEAEGEHLNEVQPLAETPDAPLLVARLVGNPEMKAEELLAYELGYRTRLTERLNLDLATFYHRYDHHFSGEPVLTLLDTTVAPTQLLIHYTAGNLIEGETLGGELNAEWRLHDRWRLRGGYAYLHMDMRKKAASRDPGTLEFVGDNPEHRWVIRSFCEVSERMELDAVCVYIGRLSDGRQRRLLDLDLHLGWRVRPALSLSLYGQGLLGEGRAGFDPELVDTLPSYSQRSFFGELAWHWSR